MTANPLPADIVAALLHCAGHRRRAAAELGYSYRTLARRLENHAAELARLADEHGWPAQNEAATKAAQALAGAPASPEDAARREKNAARMRKHRAKVRAETPTQEARR